jgi:glutathione-regulated potassium-efflux system ancillary protein KefC
MDPAFILAAFIGGLGAMLLRLPPLVGFLGAGFALNALGYGVTPTLATIADLGVTLLLFTIGLKLNVRTLLRAEVWGAASLHMLASTALLMVVLSLLKVAGVALLQGTGWETLALLGFALSFSSTVFAVKVLEERSEAQSLYGRLAIGVLIMQDIFAVLFLTASTGALPSPWALLLFTLVPAAPLLHALLSRVGHGEMQILFGVLLALVLGYALFDALGVKGDLGALIVGMLLAPHAAADGLAKALFNMKELLLVGFFLSIGLTALPTWEILGLALLLLALVPLKSVLFLLIFTRFRLRNRTSLLSTLSLSNFSEFGLIVAALAMSQGWFAPEWLVVLSLAVAISFVVAAPLNAMSEPLYRRLDSLLPQVEPQRLHPSDRPIELGDTQAVVLGMGKIGRGAYQRLQQHYGLRVLGIDNDAEKAARLQAEGYRLLEGDAVDSDFWEKLLVCPDVKLVLLAMPHHAGNLYALEQLRNRAFGGQIAAIVEYPDEIEPLRQRGADAVFHVYEEAGQGLADSAAEWAGVQPRAVQARTGSASPLQATTPG